ncbi:DUF6900 domain-containing protein [Enterococcus gallinarum]|uniref:DUF6900 domain-containing protein n=1 Tax=Enterococcus gallinarum TaxID=1353 RepID=UPI000E3F363A|nr:hypothetical protein [Enterococcus gallinarum]EMF0257299.1 hypothetical protein [Enterococcus hirae]RGC48144.1 hypothetical protein DXA88_04140 [Enterococcus gallinarum]
MAVSKRKIYNIAKKHIYGLNDRGDLKAHNSDREDFLDIAVWSLEEALIAAYEQGRKDGQNEPKD